MSVFRCLVVANTIFLATACQDNLKPVESNGGERFSPVSQVQGFRTVPIQAKAPLPIKLTALERELSKRSLPPIRYAAVRERLDLAGPNGELVSNIKIWLGKLSYEQCEAARIAYADGWKLGTSASGVDCRRDANIRNFHIEDFLTPAMQANYREIFEEETQEKRTPLTAEQERRYRTEGGHMVSLQTLDTNCWSTAYEILRRQSGPTAQFTVHNFNQDEVEAFLRAQLQDRTKARVNWATLKNWLQTWGTGFGDLVLVKDFVEYELETKFQVVHMAILIDDGIVFEREGNGLPGRIALLSDVAQRYPNAKFEVLRLKQDLPHVSAARFTTQFPPEVGEGDVYQTKVLVKDYQMTQAPGSRYQLVH